MTTTMPDDELAGAPELPALDEVSRRRFLTLLGGSLALGGLGGCTRQPNEPIVPYVDAPEQLVPGKPRFYATALCRGGFATGVLVESHMGRPTKIEGNPEHPASLGATDAQTQAEILALYDPARVQTLAYRGEIRPWSAFVAALGAALAAQGPKQGAGIGIVTGLVTSPTVARLMAELTTRYPALRWVQWEPCGRDNAREGARLAFGTLGVTHYRLDAARVVVTLDAELLANRPDAVRYARQLARGRHAGLRLYAVECTPTLTGTKADHRFPMRAGDIENVARHLAAAVGVPASPAGAAPPWLAAMAGDLMANRGAGAVIAGEAQPAAVHMLADLINTTLGNDGDVFEGSFAAEARNDPAAFDLAPLTAAMHAGDIDVLLTLSANPAFDGPADLRFAEAMAKVPLRVRLGLHDDETAELSHWLIPEAHALESWGDARAFDSTLSIQQPLIAPLYDGKTAAEVLAACLGQPEATAHDLTRATHATWLADDVEWRQALHDGIAYPPPESLALAVPDSPQPAVTPEERKAALDRAFGANAAPPPQGLEVTFRPDPCLFDGRYATNAWLQELPKPLTKFTWDTAALIAPATARRLGLATGDVVELTLRGRSVEAPIWVMPGHAAESVTVPLGGGRRRAGAIGTGVGFDGYALRTSAAPWIDSGLGIRKTGRTHRFAMTQEHDSMEGRDIVRTRAFAEPAGDVAVHGEAEPGGTPHADTAGAHGAAAAAGAHGAGAAHGEHPSMYPPHPYPGYAWGMAIDLASCIGCNACVIACQSENNIPVVGKEQVARGREMHWLRIDRYYEGDEDAPTTVHQPVPCMHCENAPCEVVCPVGATVHSAEGLNDMVYNRCVGTKYCSNNCPYKVRRFNFLYYSEEFRAPSMRMLANPDVTVRSRGVMEKCTYCVQRISAARITSEREGRRIADGEVVTACQQVCPAEAIHFGDVNDPASRVSKLKGDSRNYGLLAELNTKPRTTYLDNLRNLNPELKG